MVSAQVSKSRRVNIIFRFSTKTTKKVESFCMKLRIEDWTRWKLLRLKFIVNAIKNPHFLHLSLFAHFFLLFNHSQHLLFAFWQNRQQHRYIFWSCSFFIWWLIVVAVDLSRRDHSEFLIFILHELNKDKNDGCKILIQSFGLLCRHTCNEWMRRMKNHKNDNNKRWKWKSTSNALLIIVEFVWVKLFAACSTLPLVPFDYSWGRRQLFTDPDDPLHFSEVVNNVIEIVKLCNFLDI